MFTSYKDFILALRKVMPEFNFVVPKVEKEKREHPIIHIGAKIEGRTQWVTFLLVLDEQQFDFIVNTFSPVRLTV
jgi:hypothetical protein